MKGIQKIYVAKKLVAQIVRGKENFKEGIYFFSHPSDSIQLAHHKYTKERTTNVHHNKLKKPITLYSKQKYIYIITGQARVELLKQNGQAGSEIILDPGDGIIIGDILHKVIFYKGSKAIEIKQGPYEE